MICRTLLVKWIAISALLVSACNPIPATPAPTSMPSDRNPMQMDVYDVASWLARTDALRDESIGPDRYVDALLRWSDCLGETTIEVQGVVPEGELEYQWFKKEIEQELPPGEQTASEWATIFMFMFLFTEEVMEEPFEGAEPTYIYALETMASDC